MRILPLVPFELEIEGLKAQIREQEIREKTFREAVAELLIENARLKKLNRTLWRPKEARYSK